MERTYSPPATVFERTRLTLASVLVPLVWTLALWTLRLLPPSHPFRIYNANRIRHTRALAPRALCVRRPGRLLPFQLPYLLSFYLALDSVSFRVKGPFDLIPEWHLDERVRLLSRLAHAATPLLAGLLG